MTDRKPTSLATVTLNGMPIGGIVHYPVHKGCLFISQLPSGAGRSRTPKSYEATVKAVQKRFPDAVIVAKEAS